MLEICYSDRQIVVCVKPVGVLSQGDGGTTMLDLLGDQLAAQRESIYPIHRLDREVGGVMVYARTKDAAADLSAQVRERRLEKAYLAVLQGTPAEPSGTYRDLLFRDARKNKTYVVDRQRKGVREAVLRYQTLETRGAQSLVQVQLETGRTHQIRVQFAARKTPLLGDRRYGGAEAVAMGLWAFRLAFRHPGTGERMQVQHLPQTDSVWAVFADALTALGRDENC